jgi:hypothetical protein
VGTVPALVLAQEATMTRPNRPKLYAAGGTALLIAGTLLSTTLGTASASAPAAPGKSETRTFFTSLNNSGVRGKAEVDVRHRHLDIDIDARGLTKGVPHAQHIHYGAQAAHECPGVAQDADHDFRLTTAEGVPSYGPVAVSLTTRGHTGPGSVLAVNRYPVTKNGHEHYDRQTRTKRAVARAIRNGEAVVVIHGIDYNDNGKYDFKGAGKSELDPNLPAEATDPVACGVLRMHR